MELFIFSILEIILAVWLLTGWKLFYSAILSFVVLIAISLTNLGILDITFRDIGLALAALSLALLAKKQEEPPNLN